MAKTRRKTTRITAGAFSKQAADQATRILRNARRRELYRLRKARENAVVLPPYDPGDLACPVPGGCALCNPNHRFAALPVQRTIEPPPGEYCDESREFAVTEYKDPSTLLPASVVANRTLYGAESSARGAYTQEVRRISL